MITSISVALQVTRKEECLAGSGKKEQTIVDRYKDIIDSLKNGEINEDGLINKRTKYGEKRIANCLKYDLGFGYRLVTIKKGVRLFVVFFGSHVETDHWIRKNINYQPSENTKLYQLNFSVRQSENLESFVHKQKREETVIDEYEMKLAQKIDESLLKDIFQGLYNTQEV